MRTSVLGLVVVVLALLGASATTAGAATMTLSPDGSTLTWAEGPNVVNDTTVTIAYGALAGSGLRVTVTDPNEAAPPVPPAGCSNVGGGVTCPDLGALRRLRVLTGTQGDQVAASTTADPAPSPGALAFARLGRLEVDAGTGTDTVTVAGLADPTTAYVDGGAGTDVLTGSTDPDVLDVADFSTRAGTVGADLDGAADDGVAGENEDLGTAFNGLAGGPVGDVLTGNAVANHLEGGGGKDDLFGGGGADTASYRRDPAGVVVNLPPAANTGADDLDSIEIAEGSEFADVLTSDTPANRLLGRRGSDTLRPGTGNDRVAGDLDLVGVLPDALADDPADVDVLDLTTLPAGVAASLDGAADDGAAGETADYGPDLDQVLGTAQADVVTGTPGADHLDGRGGPDQVDGLGGADLLLGGAGADTLLARDGVQDAIGCGSEADTATVDLAEASVVDCETVLAPAPPPTPTPTAPPATPTPSATPTPRAVPPPAFQRTGNVEPVRGTVIVTRDGRRERIVTLSEVRDGDLIDVTSGEIVLTTARRDGALQTVRLSKGVFRLDLTTGADRVDFVLAGGSFRSCRRGERASKAVVHRRSRRRRLWGDGRGRYRTRGRTGSAAVRGTFWIVEDFCDGTEVRVRRGTVDVLNRRGRRLATLERPGGRARAFVPLR